jgi:hypothetical protein
MDAPRRRTSGARRGSLALFATVLLLPLGACASLEFRRNTESSGTFESRGWAFTLFSMDIPKTAEQVARENASDANLPNMQVSDVRVTPWFGPLDWLLDIISVRYCRIDGTWGFPGPAERARAASR